MTASAAPFYLPYKTRWIVSVDLGQTIDPTAIAVGEVTPRRRQLTVADFDDFGRYRPDLQPAPAADGMPERIDVRHLERLPLRMSYVDQVAHVRGLMQSPDLRGAELIVDQTGVGRAVVDFFRRARMKLTAITITAGADETPGPKPDEKHVPKLMLVSRVQSLLHGGELHVAPALPEAKTLVSELQDFRGTFNETGYARFGAREGAHDDLVLALALLCWAACRPARPQWGRSAHGLH